MAQQPFHGGTARALCQTTEDPARVQDAWDLVLPGVACSAIEIEGHWGNPLLQLSADLDRRDALRTATSWFDDPALRAVLLDELSARVDDQGVLHVRFKKQAAANGTRTLASTRTSDPILVRLNVATYPARRDLAIRSLQDLAARSLPY